MPTPMPIIAVTCGANDGMSMKRASRLTTARPIPMPNSAVMIGRPIASTDPNAINRMKTAASITDELARRLRLVGEHRAAQLDLQLLRVRLLDDVAHMRGEIDRYVVGLQVELQVGVRDLAVARDLPLAAGRVRRSHRNDVLRLQRAAGRRRPSRSDSAPRRRARCRRRAPRTRAHRDHLSETHRFRARRTRAATRFPAARTS